jgi:hypothetical protein
MAGAVGKFVALLWIEEIFRLQRLPTIAGLAGLIVADGLPATIVELIVSNHIEPSTADFAVAGAKSQGSDIVKTKKTLVQRDLRGLTMVC